VVLFLIGINDVGAGNLEAAATPPEHYLRRRWRALLNRSEVYALGQNLSRYFLAQNRGLHHTQVDLKKAGTLDLPSGAESRRLQDYEADSLPFFAARLTKLVKVCRDQGIEPVLITQPTLYGPGVDPVTGVDLAVIKVGDKNGRFMFQVIALYNGVTRQVAQKDGVLLIDLARDLPRNSAFYYDYLHYTEPGAAAVAEIVARRLEPWLAQQFPLFRKSSPPRD